MSSMLRRRSSFQQGESSCCSSRRCPNCIYSRALRSPQLLELSGIGRKDVLDKIGVPVKIDLPGVGENMQEHIVDFVTFGRYTNRMKIICTILIASRITELNDKQNFNTFDALRDPVELATQLEL